MRGGTLRVRRHAQGRPSQFTLRLPTRPNPERMEGKLALAARVRACQDQRTTGGHKAPRDDLLS
jgi:hypothetical protein